MKSKQIINTLKEMNQSLEEDNFNRYYLIGDLILRRQIRDYCELNGIGEVTNGFKK